MRDDEVCAKNSYFKQLLTHKSRHVRAGYARIHEFQISVEVPIYGAVEVIVVCNGRVKQALVVGICVFENCRLMMGSNEFIMGSREDSEGNVFVHILDPRCAPPGVY